MKIRTHLRYFTSLALLSALCLTPFAQYAQEGYSSASFSMGKMRSHSLQVPLPEEVIVEEYVNYHRHNIPRPTKAGAVTLDLQWGAHVLAEGGARAVMQVGIATAKHRDRSSIPPVNISLVIDKSGSMSGDRIAKARDAAHAFVDRLDEGDVLSIVAFDHEPELILPATVIRNRSVLHRAIDRIHIGGSTNMNAGMILGYDQLMRHYKAGQTNRILMLTDALTNTGVVNPHAMVANSQYYNAENDVDFTIVGVGVNFNNALSRQLTGDARGSIHFINDAADIQKVFMEEVDALLAPVGREVELEIEWDPALRLRKLFGYTPEAGQHKLRIPLENLNGGLTMVVLGEFELPAWRGAPKGLVTAKLRYREALSGKRQDLQVSAAVDAYDYRNRNSEVEKNYAIAQLADGLRQMAELCQKRQPREARGLITSITAYHKLNAVLCADPDVKRVLDIAERYAATLPPYAQGY